MKRKKWHHHSRGRQTVRRQWLLGSAVFLVLAAVAVMIAMIAYRGLSNSIFFQISELEISGCKYVDSKTITVLSGLDVQTNLWTVQPAAIEKVLAGEDWVAGARVRKKWPGRLEIVVKERVPRAKINTEEGLYYVDRGGVVFAPIRPGDDFDLPLITGLELTTGHSADGLEQETLADMLAFIRYAASGNAALSGLDISELHGEEDGSVVMFPAERAFPVYLGRGEMWRKYSRLSKVLSWLYRNREFENTDYIDMNYMKDGNQSGAGGRVLVGFRS